MVVVVVTQREMFQAKGIHLSRAEKCLVEVKSLFLALRLKNNQTFISFNISYVYLLVILFSPTNLVH